MKLNYFIQLIRDCAFNMVFINVFFFFPLSAISNKLITNLKLDGYIELYYFFFVFFSLPFAITIVITKEIYKSIKKKSRFEKHLEADSETVPLIKYLKFYNHNIDTEDKTFIKKIINTKDINLTNDYGDTILHYISRIKPKSLYIPLLLSCGANPYIKNKNGETAMQYIDNMFAVLCAKKENKEILMTMKSNISANISKKARL